jgi:hypothetical protein
LKTINFPEVESPGLNLEPPISDGSAKQLEVPKASNIHTTASYACGICASPDRTRVEGWILAGVATPTVEGWCRELDPPIVLSRHTIDDHIAHISDEGISKPHITTMLIKYGREANDLVDCALRNPGSVKSNVLNTAMTVRLRSIELLAKAHNVIDAGPRTVKQELNVILPPDIQKRMLQAEIKKLEDAERIPLPTPSK